MTMKRSDYPDTVEATDKALLALNNEIDKQKEVARALTRHRDELVAQENAAKALESMSDEDKAAMRAALN